MCVTARHHRIRQTGAAAQGFCPPGADRPVAPAHLALTPDLRPANSHRCTLPRCSPKRPAYSIFAGAEKHHTGLPGCPPGVRNPALPALPGCRSCRKFRPASRSAPTCGPMSKKACAIPRPTRPRPWRCKPRLPSLLAGVLPPPRCDPDPGHYSSRVRGANSIPAEIDGKPTSTYFHWLAMAYAVTHLPAIRRCPCRFAGSPRNAVRVTMSVRAVLCAGAGRRRRAGGHAAGAFRTAKARPGPGATEGSIADQRPPVVFGFRPTDPVWPPDDINRSCKRDQPGTSILVA